MMEYRPPRQNATARIVLLCLFAAAALLFVAGALAGSFAAIPQALGICLFIPIIQISTRYVFSQYLYRLRPTEDGALDLEIYQCRAGGAAQLVCRIGKDEIKAAVPLSKENRKPPKSVRRYQYAPDLAPAAATVLSVENRDGVCEVLFCPSEEMLRLLAPDGADD